jgi:lipopolysaccharide export system permease protein
VRTLNLYINKNVAVVLLIAITVTTFVLVAVQFGKVFQTVAGGVPLSATLLYIVYRLPHVLTYTIPLALAASVAWVFCRMSAENEIMSLRASGISIVQIIAPVVVASMVLSGLCVVLQFHFAPTYKAQAKWLFKRETIRNPLQLLEPDQYIELFSGYTIYVGSRDGDTLRNVHIKILDEDAALPVPGSDARRAVVQQEIHAVHGRIDLNEAAKKLTLILNDVTVTWMDPEYPDDVTRFHRGRAERMSLPLDYGEQLNRRSLSLRTDELDWQRLFARIQLASEWGKDSSKLLMELHRRAALSLAPFSLVLAVVPCVLWRGRRENSERRLAAALGIVVAFFIGVQLIESLHTHPELRPELLIWLPGLCCQVVGMWALWRKR